ncbi:MAG: DNA internalization-related competence protein ComEC/Rec2 [Candidatus Aminicenantes bacterium]|nr:DNA internalization-related competence protein ComEC/Rec2 [Candidatus Aminicenantes bacterium]
MAFPLLHLAVALAAGILSSSVLSIPSVAGLAAAAFVLATAWAAFRLQRNKLAYIFLLLAMTVMGAWLTNAAGRRYDQNPLHNWRAEDYADFQGRLVRTPARERDRDILLIDVEDVRYGGQELILPGRLQLVVSRPAGPEAGPRLDLFATDRVRVSARLSRRREYDNFQAPLYGRLLRNRGIHARAFTKSPLLVEKVADGPAASPRRALSRLRRRLLDALEVRFPGRGGQGISPRGAVLEALLLGEDGRLDPGLERSLQGSGLYHLFAISGGHIAVITFLLFFLLKAAHVPRRPSYAILIILLIAYSGLVEGNASVVRAVIMAVAFCFGRLLWRDAHILNAIGLSALVLLILNPFSLFDAGFELTYAATLAIILFAPRLLKRAPRLPLGLSELGAMSVAALLGVLPFMAAIFNRATFSSLLLNFAAIPLVGLIMGLGYVFLPLALLFPAAGRPFAAVLDVLVLVFERVARLLDPVKALSYRVPTPKAWTVIGYVLFLLLLLVPVRFKRLRLASGALFVVFAAILVTYPFPPRAVQELRLTVLDVGQGEATLVEFPGRRKMLVDAGGYPEGSFDVGESVVSPFLWSLGMKRVDVLVLTHAHPDHLYGLPAVARNFAVGEFWEGAAPEPNPVYQELLRSLPPSVPRRRLGRGDRERRGEVGIEVLHPARETAGGADNDLSLVLRLSIRSDAVLLPGDIGRAVEAELLEAGCDVRALVLKSPHHGSLTSSSPEFLAAVGPSVVVVSAGEGNLYGFPNPEVLRRYAAVGASVFRTDVHGAVEVSLGRGGLRVRSAAGPTTGD